MELLHEGDSYMEREQGLAEIRRTRIIAIVRGVEESDAERLAEALRLGGITVMEITMNTPGAERMIRRLRETFVGKMFIGAGTVTDSEELAKALEAGASFAVTPNTDEEVIRQAADAGIPIFPGAMTPSEIVRAWKAGATAVKLFPSASLGLGYIQELQGPLSHIPMIAVGGVRPDNIAEFLRAGCYAVGVGSSIVNLRQIKAGNWSWIEEQARKLVQEALPYGESVAGNEK
jgi:2-dehydro-3-deoxyphosphogluconate aldolase/(4S)-4-hydroxy-2-oxoglutarate aldolase